MFKIIDNVNFLTHPLCSAKDCVKGQAWANLLPILQLISSLHSSLSKSKKFIISEVITDILVDMTLAMLDDKSFDWERVSNTGLVSPFEIKIRIEIK